MAGIKERKVKANLPDMLMVTKTVTV